MPALATNDRAYRTAVQSVVKANRDIRVQLLPGHPSYFRWMRVSGPLLGGDEFHQVAGLWPGDTAKTIRLSLNEAVAGIRREQASVN